MKIAVISFTKAGAKLCSRLTDFLSGKSGISCSGFVMPNLAGAYGLNSLRSSVRVWAGEAFVKCDEIIFIGDMETAVRSIAPHIGDRHSDPGVIVIDERGSSVIPVLSGKGRSSEELAERISQFLSAVPVFTNGEQVQSVFSPDVFAAKNNLFITDRLKARRVSANVMDGKLLRICCPPTQIPEGAGFSVSQILMKKILWVDNASGADIIISCQMPDEGDGLVLVPRQCIWIGVNCRRGCSFTELQDALSSFVGTYSLHEQSLAGIASIDIKKDEEGIQDLCRFYQFPLKTYSAAQLMSLKGEFASSEFVHLNKGSDNVCERAALMAAAEKAAAAKNGAFALSVISKQKYGGITLAAAYVNRRMVMS